MRNQKGQIFIIGLITLAIITLTTLLLASGSLLLTRSSKSSLETVQVLNLAEAGIDKAVASLNKTGGSYTGEAETLLGLGSYESSVTSINSSTLKVIATGYIPNKANAKAKKRIQIQVSKGVGTDFKYGMQLGEGGINMGNDSTIAGSVYSNGNITGGNNNTITGDVWVAGGTQPTADQTSDCSGMECQDFIFGKNIDGQNIQDTAQSFQPGSSQILNKIAVKIKKSGSPANITVKIVGDNNGQPNKNNVKTSGTLSANLVTTAYSFIDVSFANAPNLAANTTYWIMLHSAAIDNSNFWYWSNSNIPSYTRGSPAWSSNWQSGNPAWTAISGDLGFKTFMGGVITNIVMGGGSRVNGSVHANTINGLIIAQNAYYQTILASTVNGTSFPGSPDPAPAPFPISDANITEWKTQAGNENQYASITSCIPTLGPGKVTGNINIGGPCNITVKTPLWVTGNITNGNSVKFILDSSFGFSSGVIVVDGTTTMGNGNDFVGSGQTGSYLMLLSTYDSRASGIKAVDSGNTASSAIIYAPLGLVNLGNSATFKEISAWKIDTGNNTVINYESGLATVFFASGPSGSFSIVPSTYQIVSGPILPIANSPPPIPPLSVTCSGSPDPATSGSTVTWSATPSGGTPAYVDYIWSGDDALSGTGPSTTKVYTVTNQTTKNASISVKDSSTPQKIATASCSVTINPLIKRVFITSTRYTSGNLGGLAGGDNICQTRANTAALGGTWKAWLSDNTTSVASRFIQSSAGYKRIDGITVASSWADLTDGTLQNPIDKDEFGVALPIQTGVTFTGTDINGGSIANRNCSSWGSSTGLARGGPVTPTTGSTWTNTGFDTACSFGASSGRRLFCFEQ